jgi:3-oxoacyl-[acyl-carrier protein] reductase
MKTGMVIAVTGATGFIGAEICRAMAATHDTVVGIYRCSEDRARALEREIGDAGNKFRSVRCDLTDPAALHQGYQEMKNIAGPPAVMVLAAGSKLRGSALLTRQDAVRPLFDVNVAAQIEFARLSLKEMIKAGFGRIIVVGSRAGLFGFPGQAAYAASKAALAGWAASVSGEVGNYGITVNVVAPGAMKEAGDGIYDEREQAMIIERIGCRRLGTPEDVAAAVAFLASSGASYINGVTLPVDGGARF